MAKERTVRQKLKILRENYHSWMRYDGVHYIDVGYKYKDGGKTGDVCFRFHVYNKFGNKFLKERAIPGILEDVSTDIVVSNPGETRRFGKPYGELKGGIEIRNCYLPGSGTLGCIFRDKNDRLVGLSNYHVLLGQYGQVGQPVMQPSLHNVTDNTIIGTIHRDGVRALDAAIFAMNTTRPSFPYEILDNLGGIRKSAIADIGMHVKKSGVATDLTFGIVDGLGIDSSFSVAINADKPPAENILTAEGDSGSAWLLDNNASDTIVGLNFLRAEGITKARAFDIAKVMTVLKLKFI